MFFKAMSKCVWLGSGEAPLDLRQALQADSPLQKKPDEEVNLMNIYSGQDTSPTREGRGGLSRRWTPDRVIGRVW